MRVIFLKPACSTYAKLNGGYLNWKYELLDIVCANFIRLRQPNRIEPSVYIESASERFIIADLRD